MCIYTLRLFCKIPGRLCSWFGSSIRSGYAHQLVSHYRNSIESMHPSHKSTAKCLGHLVCSFTWPMNCNGPGFYFDIYLLPLYCFLHYQLLFKTVISCLPKHGKPPYFLFIKELSRVSPFLFNIAINHCYHISQSTSEYCGYFTQLHAANSIGLPPVDVPIYVLWSDSFDDSSTGWYRAKVTYYHCNSFFDLF